MLDREFWLKQGPITRNRYRDHIFTKAKDVKGNSFKGYSKLYKEKKQVEEVKIKDLLKVLSLHLLFLQGIYKEIIL